MLRVLLWVANGEVIIVVVVVVVDLLCLAKDDDIDDSSQDVVHFAAAITWFATTALLLLRFMVQYNIELSYCSSIRHGISVHITYVSFFFRTRTITQKMSIHTRWILSILVCTCVYIIELDHSPSHNSFSFSFSLRPQQPLMYL